MRGSDLSGGGSGRHGSVHDLASGSEGVLEGFWIPEGLRQRVLASAAWDVLWLRGGALVDAGSPGAVPVRCPRLDARGMEALVDGLRQARTLDGNEVAARWETALAAALPKLFDRATEALPLLAGCTGYSAPMLRAALGAGDLVDAEGLAKALDYRPTWSVASRWESLPDMPGKVRFFPSALPGRLRAGSERGLRRSRAALFSTADPIDLAVGFAAGNVPGTGFVMSLLAGMANHAAGVGTPAPAVVVRNSRHEPVFAPWVLGAVEAVDPELVAATALLVWDYDDQALQGVLLGRAGLMLAAAGDDTIASLDRDRAVHNPALRFHRHGHKASFAVVDGEGGLGPEASPTLIAGLAALDSAVWDQNGCLSARVHFVHGEAGAYARALADGMRAVSAALPRGATPPRRLSHRSFDTYISLEGSRRVHVYSSYDDDFVVALDARPWCASSLGRAVNACQGRVVVVRPVDDLGEVPRFLETLPRANLQSVSVAMAGDRVEAFAEEVGARGVTAIRSLGRAAFPQLAYSWDGLLPADLACERPAGHFTTIEFDHLEDEIADALARPVDGGAYWPGP